MPWTYVLWDWNGTLLDDVQTAVDVNNEIFPRFGFSPPGGVVDYHRLFRFPVREYYRDLGVNDDVFPAIANAWAEGYREKSIGCHLQKHALEALEAFHQAGFQQAILSASKEEYLHEQLERYPIGGYFQAALGLTHIYATSKVDIAKGFLKSHDVDPKQAVFLGDTLHDAEVAQAIGCDCILIARGHQPWKTLLEAGVPVFEDLEKTKEYVLAQGLGPQAR
jgi:phosphoglycolate phosphatase